MSIQNAVVADVTTFETDNKFPYTLGFAVAGRSGYSFGAAQNDLTNSVNLKTFSDILNNTQSISGLSSTQINQIESAAANPGFSSINS